MAGNTGSGATNINIEFVNIQSKGDGQDFGQMITAVDDGGSCCDKTRGVAACALSNSVTMEFITMATFGNAQDFGDLTSGRRPRGCSNQTRGVFAGGDPITNIIDFVLSIHVPFKCSIVCYVLFVKICSSLFYQF